MKHITTSADRAVEIATERLHNSIHEGEPAKPEARVIDLATFMDAPYDFVCPDSADQDEQDKLVADLHDGLFMVLDKVDTARLLGDKYAVTAGVRTTWSLANLGLAVLRIAESRGLTYEDGQIVQVEA